MARDFTDIRPIHKDCSALHIIKPHQQINQRRLAAAGRSDDCNFLPRLDLKIEITDELLPFCIREVDLLQFHSSVKMLRCLCLLGIRHLGLLLNQIQNSPRTRNRILQLCDNARNLIERLCVLARIGQEGRQLADGKVSCDGSKGARHTNHSIHQAVDKACRRVRDGGEEDCPKGGFLQLLIDSVKLTNHLFPPVKGLDNLLPLNHLIDQAGLLSPDLRLFAEHGIGMRRNIPGHQEGERRQSNHCNGNSDVDGQHEAERTQNGNHSREQLCKAHQKTVRKLIGVRDHAALDFSVGMGINIGKRELFNLMKSIVPDVPHNVIGHLVVAQVHQPLSKAGEHGADRYFDDDTDDSRKLHFSRTDHKVHNFTGQLRNIQLQRHRHKGKCKRKPEENTIASEIAQNLFDDHTLRSMIHFLFLFLCHSHASSSFGNWE